MTILSRSSALSLMQEHDNQDVNIRSIQTHVGGHGVSSSYIVLDNVAFRLQDALAQVVFRRGRCAALARTGDTLLRDDSHLVM